MGQATEAVVFRFQGRLPRASFAAFAAHRAARLSLDHRILAQDDRHAVIAVAGPPVLVDAFEMALSLGPQDCIVLEIDRRDTPQEEGPR